MQMITKAWNNVTDKTFVDNVRVCGELTDSEMIDSVSTAIDVGMHI